MKKIINLQLEWKEKEIDINQLLLDEGNIRLDSNNKTQESIIADLFSNEKAMEILDSIRKNNFFPDEPPVVIKSKDKYIVIDGNRRVGSLKAMLSPNIAPDKYQKKIKKMMNDYEPIQKIKVVIVPNRGSVDKYLAAKHTKTTRRPWSHLRRAYFYYKKKESGTSIEELIKIYNNKDIPMYIKMYEMQLAALSLENISDYTRKKISSKNFEITTLQRLYNDKYVQDKLEITFNSTTGEVTIPKNEEFDKAYSKIITDIVEEKISSRKNIATPEDRKKYIDRIVPKKIDSKVKIGVSKVARKTIKDDKDIYLISNDMISTLDSSAIDRVLKELQSIDCKKFPNISSAALPGFLESVLKEYFEIIEKEIPEFQYLKHREKDREIDCNSMSLKQLFNTAKNYFESTKNKSMVQVIGRIEKDKRFLNEIKHNHYIFATNEDTKNSWDTMQPLVKFIFDDVKSRKTKT